MSAAAPDSYFRKGFGLGADVRSDLDADYAGEIVDWMQAQNNRLTIDGLTVRLAREFGFCYGVERAVEYAYQTRRKFPDRSVFLLGEIIHNPHVNDKLRRMGIRILDPRPDAPDGEPRFAYDDVPEDAVVILPAFGVTMADFQALRSRGCIIVDTTCGSVLNVWKRVESYARDGLTSLIHGKHYHEETKATASQVLKYTDGAYLIVRDIHESEDVFRYVEALGAGTVTAAARAAFLTKFSRAVSPGFDPDRHLRRVGVANQTTMLARESLAIGAKMGEAIARAFGEGYARENFRTFDTICSATQDRQDAVLELLTEGPAAMIVVGGFNSSNTISLAALCAERVPTYHVEDAASIDPATGSVQYRPAGIHHAVATMTDWMPPSPVVIGITAGASTPNNKIGDAVSRIFATRRISLREHVTR